MIKTFLLKFVFLLIVLLAVGCNKDKRSDEEKILDYIEENNIEATRHESGLYYKITQEGEEGHFPTINSTVSVLYRGYLLDGTVFDQTLNQVVAKFPLTNVIEGWQIGIPLIEKGGKALLIIPSNLAYGSSSPSAAIPKNSVLAFDIELNNIE